ncbi:hypothetical protein G6F59_018373 [Rhizopus arrhizus]|nr:hypothetical protein G6F59_018373 [Rhizopus arrhizus]
MAANHPQVRVGVALGATATLLDMLRGERIDAMVCDARMLYDAADIDARPLAPLRAGMGSSSIRWPPAPSAPRCRYGWPKRWGPVVRPKSW